MDIKAKIHELLDKINALQCCEQEKKANALPDGCYFLNADEILCKAKKFGDSRYPYSTDGLTLWAYSSGNVKIEESRFNVIVDFPEGKEPNLAFYSGKRTEDGYFPVSITGAGKLPFERGVERFTVFTPDAAYYFAKTEDFISCARLFIDERKNFRVTLYTENLTEKPVDTYLSAYFNCMLMHLGYDLPETKWFRSVKSTDNGFDISVTEYYDRYNHSLHTAHIARDCGGKKVFSTTSHADFAGGMNNQLCCSTALINGKFTGNKDYTEFTDTGISGDIIPLKLQSKDSYAVSYTLTLGGEEKAVKTADIDKLLYDSKKEFGKDIPKVTFDGNWKDLSGESLGKFIKNVFRQTEFCTRAKNYAGPLIGIRDIFQQLEAAIMWIPDYCRKKIVEALNFIGEDGRAPRQYSYPQNKNQLPAMDLRPYIDQGVWVISTVYKYLCYTGDFTILKEVCGYYKFDGNRVNFSAEKDTVLDHLIRIADYLISKLDENTGCLRALYGDWNDALDGLGKTDDAGKEYGNGVSVMATLQLYKNLKELAEILEKLGKPSSAEKYKKIRENIKIGLQKYAVVSNGKGERKILHGWFDKRDALVGSFSDNDGKERDGLAATSFWVIAEMLKEDESLKKDILAAYSRLDSKYGLKTFEPYFGKDNDRVGRINRLPKGTAENGATYIHATLFGIWSLFEMGEDEKAWEQIYKILPITHKFISTTPFVMPNSYAENAEKGFDGESMSDWFTGSGCVLLKVLLWYVFGIKADLDGVKIQPSKALPFKGAELTIKIRGKETTVKI